MYEMVRDNIFVAFEHVSQCSNPPYSKTPFPGFSILDDLDFEFWQITCKHWGMLEYTQKF